MHLYEIRRLAIARINRHDSHADDYAEYKYIPVIRLIRQHEDMMTAFNAETEEAAFSFF